MDEDKVAVIIKPVGAGYTGLSSSAGLGCDGNTWFQSNFQMKTD